MLFSKEYVGYLAREVTKKLIAGKFIETATLPAVTERVNAALVDELSLEDRINDEVRVILEAYSDEMRNTGANYQEMFRKVKTSSSASTRRCCETEPRQSQRAGAGRLRRSQADGRSGVHRRSQHNPPGNPQNSRRIADAGSPNRRCRPAEDRLQKRTILEGSQEWDIFYRKYYNEEVKETRRVGKPR